MRMAACAASSRHGGSSPTMVMAREGSDEFRSNLVLDLDLISVFDKFCIHNINV